MKFLGCPFGYQSKVDNWTCLNADSTQLSWDAAQAACHKNYSTLARIDNSFQNSDFTSKIIFVKSTKWAQILDYLTSKYNQCNKFYIGLYNIQGTWKWAVDDTISFDGNSFRNWKSGK